MHLLPHHQPAARGDGARRGPPGVCVSVCTFILSSSAAAASDLRRTECHRGRLLTPDKVRRPPRACAGPSRGLPSARREQDEMGSASALCKPSDTQVSGGQGAEVARRLTFHAVCFWAPTSVLYAWVAYAVTSKPGGSCTRLAQVCGSLPVDGGVFRWDPRLPYAVSPPRRKLPRPLIAQN